MKAHDAADILAQIVAALAARLAGPAGERAIHHHRIADCERRHIGPGRCYHAGRFCTHHQRQLALGEGHAAIAPQIDVIEPDRLDTDLDFARGRCGRRRHVGELELAVGN